MLRRPASLVPSRISPKYTACTPNFRRFSSSQGQKGSKPPLEAGADPQSSVFAKILRGEIPAKRVYEDERTLAFHDIAPVAPFHVLVIPKKPIGGVLDMQQEDAPLIGHLIYVANKVARDLGFADEGFRLVVNQGTHGQQSVRWLHVHVIGGRQLKWPPG